MNEPINYQREYERLSAMSKTFKPTAGQHTIKFLTNGEFFESEYDGKTIPKVKYSIMANGETMTWFVTRGQTSESLFGQLLNVSKNHSWSLNGVLITLAVRGEGKQRQYWVSDPLKPTEEQFKGGE